MNRFCLRMIATIQIMQSHTQVNKANKQDMFKEFWLFDFEEKDAKLQNPKYQNRNT
jgi:autonomous glycyl radical cofactor GrcA